MTQCKWSKTVPRWSTRFLESSNGWTKVRCKRIGSSVARLRQVSVIKVLSLEQVIRLDQLELGKLNQPWNFYFKLPMLPLALMNPLLILEMELDG